MILDNTQCALQTGPLLSHSFVSYRHIRKANMMFSSRKFKERMRHEEESGGSSSVSYSFTMWMFLLLSIWFV